MNKTSIEWVKNPGGSQGYTWNPITGCLNHVNGLCKGGGFPCYAYKLANGRLKQRYLANHNVAAPLLSGRHIDMALADPFYPRFWEERLCDPTSCLKDELNYYWQKPKGIFVCDMGELFGDWIPQKWQEDIFGVIRACRQLNHRFYLLTKQPQNLIKWSPFPENCWVGVTATNENMAFRGLSQFLQIAAPVKYLSLEPLLGCMPQLTSYCLIQAGVSWLIIGAQTKPYKPPEIAWVREIVEAADKAGIPAFLKDNLRPLLIPSDCSRPNYLTEDIFWASEKAQLRQEMPK